MAHPNDERLDYADDEPVVLPRKAILPGVHVIALLCALMPFFISVTTSVATRTPWALEVQQRDWGALGGGALAIALGGLAFALLGRVPERRRRRAWVAGFAMLLGAVHVIARSGFLL